MFFIHLFKVKKILSFSFSQVFLVGCILVTFSLIAFLEGDVSLLDIVSTNRPRFSAIIGNIEAATNFFVVSFPLIIMLAFA